jgi:hypothetical protein
VSNPFLVDERLRRLEIAVAALRTAVDNATLGVTVFRGDVFLPKRNDSNRGKPSQEGRIIYNEDDSKLNIDNGTNWTLADGTTT